MLLILLLPTCQPAWLRHLQPDKLFSTVINLIATFVFRFVVCLFVCFNNTNLNMFAVNNFKNALHKLHQYNKPKFISKSDCSWVLLN